MRSPATGKDTVVEREGGTLPLFWLCACAPVERGPKGRKTALGGHPLLLSVFRLLCGWVMRVKRVRRKPMVASAVISPSTAVRVTLHLLFPCVCSLLAPSSL